MEERRHIGIFLGIIGILVLFLSFGNIAITGAVIGTGAKFNFSFFTILGFILIAVFLIIEFQESKQKNVKKKKKQTKK
jgi:hypothetical protein